jgi:hypothetical protein
MKRDLLLVPGILLSTASQLRPAGEICLVIWIGLRLDGLTVLLCGLTIFSIFHLIVRHPSFWFAIAICLVAAESRKAVPARQWS